MSRSPPLVLLTEIEGTPLYLHTETAQILSLHGDATLTEVASEFAGASSSAEFADALSDAGAGITFDQLLELAAAVRTWKSWRPTALAASERTAVIAKGLGLTPKKLLAAVARRPTVFEWLGPLGDTTPVAPAKPALQKLEVIEKLPRSFTALEGKAALDLKPVLTTAALDALPKLRALRQLCVRLPSEAVLPVLDELQSLTVWGGAISPLPKLEQLTAWAGTKLPKAMPALKALTLSPGDAALGPLLKIVSGWQGLELLVVTNVWPQTPRVPSEFKLLKKVKSLRRLRLVNTAFTRDTKGLAALEQALRPCVVEAV
ncbi:MAG: hypothetical protein GQE15_03840 [Archangiaceae bacterium]|nr:hypothetical protein [Archangiaceae bacterium]